MRIHHDTSNDRWGLEVDGAWQANSGTWRTAYLSLEDVTPEAIWQSLMSHFVGDVHRT